jgi:hypothetical protein
MNSNKFKDILTPGTVIVRPIVANLKTGIRIDLVEFRLTPKGSYMCRVNWGSGWTPEPQAFDAKFHGVVSFLKEEPPADWTHLVVTKNAMKEDGGVLFLECPAPQPDYLKFRTELFYAMYNHIDQKLERLLEKVRAMMPFGLEPGQRRVGLDVDWKVRGNYQWEVIQEGPKA